MTRYQVLRRIGCDPVASAFIAFMNWLMDYPDGVICFMSLLIEYEPKEGT